MTSRSSCEVQILADGLRRNFKTPGEILHHHPAKGAGDIQDLGLAVGETGHDGTSGEDAPFMVRRFWRPVNMRQEVLLLAIRTAANGPLQVRTCKCGFVP